MPFNTPLTELAYSDTHCPKAVAADIFVAYDVLIAVVFYESDYAFIKVTSSGKKILGFISILIYL